ncbi:MAG: hypothetical protein RL609_756 [Bacteroidota bacterium]
MCSRRCRSFFLSILAMCFHLISLGQDPAFVEKAIELGIYIPYPTTVLGEGVNFFDFDEDGWDDLTLCQTNGPIVLYRNNAGYYEPHYYFFSGQQNVATCWGDLDNNGTNDLITTSYDGGIHIYRNIDNQIFLDVSNLSNIIQQDGQMFAGIALSDINRDGLLDMGVANYSGIGKNLYLINQGDFQFESWSIDAGFANVQKHAFQPAFVDLNQDLWPDLYMINDFYEGNEFYWNESGISYSETDTTLGLNIDADAMSNSWNDFDRDGDLDLYVTNRFFGNHFLQQSTNLHFVEIADQVGANVFQWCWSATWFDAQNDGFSDLLITQNSTDIISDTSGNYFFLNAPNGNFTLDNGTFHFPTNGFASAIGDIDNDGVNDVAMSTRQGYNFKLYQNTTNNSGHFIKFRLEGHLSNRNGIGTHYTFWVNNRRHYGYTQAGENYLAQNAQNKIIGIGEYDHIDSLILQWPSSVIDRYFDLPADQLYIFEEMQNPQWWSIDDTVLCENTDTLWIEKLPLLNATWWDGTTDSTHSITAPGTYTFTLSAPFGQSKNFTIVIHGELENISSQITQNNCALDSLGSILFWNNQSNEILFQAEHLPDGIYPISINQGDCATDTVIQIEHLNPWHWNLEDTLWQCEGAFFNCPNINLDSTLTLISIATISENSYLTTWQNNAGCIQDTTIVVYVPQAPTVSTDIQSLNMAWECTLNIDGNDSPYVLAGLDWNEHSITLTQPGSYPFQIIDRWGCGYNDTLYIETPTEYSEIHSSQDLWIFDPPYLFGKTQNPITVYNVLGQSIPAVNMGRYWLLPADVHPMAVGCENQFSPIRWRYHK